MLLYVSNVCMFTDIVLHKNSGYCHHYQPFFTLLLLWAPPISLFSCTLSIAQSRERLGFLSHLSGWLFVSWVSSHGIAACVRSGPEFQIRGFPAEYCTVARWSVLLDLAVSGLNVVTDRCILVVDEHRFLHLITRRMREQKLYMKSSFKSLGISTVFTWWTCSINPHHHEGIQV